MRLQWNRTSLLVGSFVVLISLLSGCVAGPSASTQSPVDHPTDSAVPTSEPTQTSERASFAGTSITVITHEGPQIAEPLRRRAQEFAERTGATVTVTTVPFDALYDTILTDAQQATKHYDVLVFASQWMGDYVSQHLIEDLTPRIQADAALQWDDIAPFFRDISAVYQNRIYTIPLDGDFQMVYYRSDLLDQAGFDPPKTWDEYIQIAKYFHQTDLNGDASPDFGSCISKKPSSQSYHMVWSVASAFIQNQGTQQGAFFDTETMEPLVNNEAFAATLDVFAQTMAYGPPDELQLGLSEARTLFLDGRCALTLDWGDIGTLAIDPDRSKVVDKVGAVILPGSTRVLDRTSGTLVDCDKARCPYAIEGVNHAPYAAFGGWVGAINSTIDARNKDASYAFLSYVSQPNQSNIDVTIGATGFNPYRTSQFTDRTAWLQAGMSEGAASKYLGAIGVSLSSPNVVLDLRILQNQRYQEVVLDSALADFLAGKITREQTMQRIYDQWQAITDEVGREVQHASYQDSLGIKR